MEDEVSLLEYFEVIKKRWVTISIMFFITVTIAFLITLFTPKIYEAKSTIFVKSSSSGISGLVSQLGGSASFPVSSKDLFSLNYFISLLESNDLAENVIKRLDLHNNPVLIGDSKKKLTKEKLLKFMKNAVKISDNKKGLVTIKIETNNPKVSADIASEYIKLLDGLVFSAAKKKRSFIEEQLKKVKLELKLAEYSLKAFQQNNKAIALDEQVKHTFTTLVDLQKEKILDQASLKAMKSVSQITGSLPDLIELEGKKMEKEIKLNTLNKHIKDFETKLDLLPDESLKLARLVRDVKIKEEIFRLLTQQYEIAKISEQEEETPYQIVDSAFPPERHTKPKLRTNLLLGGTLGFMFGIFFVFLMEYFERTQLQKTRRTET